jgi:hypothetical protein
VIRLRVRPEQDVDSRLKKSDYDSMMNSPALNEIENEFARLPIEAQLSLMERLQRHLRVSQSKRNDSWEDQLSDMAVDPQIGREVECFNADTRITELHAPA